MRYLIDSGIVFGLRELYVSWVMLKTDTSQAILMSIVSIILIGILIWYRGMIILSSPDRLETSKNC
jgi:uncharacterized membrane protein (DUF373 family)